LEHYILYSIVIFSTFILFLYVYLIYEKVSEKYELSKRKKYEKDILPFIDELFIRIEKDSEYEDMIDVLRKDIGDKIKRKLIIERIIFYNEFYSGEIRKKVTELCEKIGLVDHEIKGLKRDDKFNLALTCKILGEFRSEAAIKPLLSIKNIKDQDSKYHMLMALSKIGEVEPLVEIFETLNETIPFSERSLTEIIDSFEGDKMKLYKSLINGNNVFLSTMIIKSAGNYMDMELNDQIKNYIDDENKERRIAAIKSIGQNSDVRFLEKIISRLDDSEWEVRAAACKSLGRMADNRIINPLTKSLSDSSWWVRYNAANAILDLPEGLNYVDNIMEGEDNFAKDITISVMQEKGILQELYLFENTADKEKRTLVRSIREYISSKQSRA